MKGRKSRNVCIFKHFSAKNTKTHFNCNQLISATHFLTMFCSWPQKLSLVRRMKANYNHGQMSWNTFELLGRFPVHTYPAPLLTPQTTLDACFQNFFFPVSALYRVGGGRTTRKFREGCTVSWYACVQTTSSPLRFLLKGGGKGGLYRGYFIREPRK